MITIGEYISYKIEKKITNLIKNQSHSSKFSKKVKFLATPLSWESYMKTDPRSNDVAGFTVITIVFTVITILSIVAGSFMLYFNWKPKEHETGFEQVWMKISDLWEMSWNNFINFKENCLTHLLICGIVIISLSIFLFFIKRFRKYLVCDLNLLWFMPLLLIIYLLLFSGFTGIYKEEIKSFWLFILPVLIWTLCLVKTWHQYIYTVRIRDKTKNTLEKAEYLSNLWQ